MNAKRIWSMLVVWALCVVLSQAGAQKSMSVLNTWLQHDVTVDGLKGMMVHGTLKVDGYKDSQMKLTAYIYHAPGKMMPDQNGKYCSANGKVAASMEFTPESDSELYGSMAIFFPYDEMHLNEGTHTYYCRLHLIDPESQRTQGEYMPFERTAAPRKKNEVKSLQVLKTSLEHGVYEQGVQGMKVRADLKVTGYGNRELEISAKFFDSDKQPLKSGGGMVDMEVRKVLKPRSEDAYFTTEDIFVPYSALLLNAGTNTYYCRVSLTDSESIYTVGDYVSFEGTGPVKKRVEVPNVWIEHGVTHNGKQGLKVHSRIEVDGYTGQDVKYILGLYDANKNAYKNPLGNQVLTATYERSVWDDFSYFVSYDDLGLKEGKHSYYMLVNVLMNDGQRGVSEFVSFEGTVSSPSQPQHNHNHNHGHNHNHNAPNHSGGKLQQAPAYHGKREGSFYYVSESLQHGHFRFYFHNGDYMAQAPGMLNLYGSFVRYVCVGESGGYYIFKQAKVYLNGGVEYLDYAPKMRVSKAWNEIICEGIALDKSDIVYVKEVSEEEYREISRQKEAYLNSIGINGGNSGNGGTSIDMSPSGSHVDKACQYCGGGGGCSSCNGTGLKYNPWGGGYDTCPSCNGSGRCFNCRGTGKQSTW